MSACLTSSPCCARLALRGAARRVRSRCGAAARASAQSAGAAHALGSRVRVKDAITVFHAPKSKAGLSLQGVVGVVEKYGDVSPEGELLSCTQPLVVRFEVPGPEGKAISFTSHLTPEEVEAC